VIAFEVDADQVAILGVFYGGQDLTPLRAKGFGFGLMLLHLEIWPAENALHKVTITAKARFGNRNHLSEMPTIWTCGLF
jgi:hypothetical protein